MECSWREAQITGHKLEWKDLHGAYAAGSFGWCGCSAALSVQHKIGRMGRSWSSLSNPSVHNNTTQHNTTQHTTHTDRHRLHRLQAKRPVCQRRSMTQSLGFSSSHWCCCCCSGMFFTPLKSSSIRWMSCCLFIL